MTGFGKNSTRRLLIILAGTLILLAGVCLLPSSRFRSIDSLESLPQGSEVWLRGVVTYYEFSGKQFYLQDETGAIKLGLTSYDYALRAGQTVEIKGTVIHPSDRPGRTSSLGIEIKELKVRGEKTLPPAILSSLHAITIDDKAGLRVEVRGIVRKVEWQGDRLLFALAADGEEGVRDVLELLRAELELAMALSGVPDIGSIGRSLVAIE